MHETDFSHEHSETAAERAAIARTIWAQDNLVFTTVGIDIGSSTSHLLFAKLILQRQSQALSSRFVVTGREIVYRSPILLTPFLHKLSGLFFACSRSNHRLGIGIAR